MADVAMERKGKAAGGGRWWLILVLFVLYTMPNGHSDT